jgi:hypothetical protein
LALEGGELMSQGEGIRLELETRPNGSLDGGQQGDDRRNHAAAGRISLGPEPQRSQKVPSFW